MYVTPRTLLAIIRLSQAMAKLCFRSEIKQADVDEAIKLMDYSIRSLRNMKASPTEKKKIGKFTLFKVSLEQDERKNDRMSKVIELAKQYLSDHSQRTLHVSEIMKKIQKSEFSVKIDKTELLEVLNHYAKLNLVYVDTDENVVLL